MDDSASGPLRAGDVGFVVKTKTSSKPYRVLAPGSNRGWWYAAAVLVAAPSLSAGARVVLAPPPRHPDAETMLLRPGEVGVLTRDDDGTPQPYRVRALSASSVAQWCHRTDVRPAPLAQPGDVVTAVNVRLGARVVRGPDWRPLDDHDGGAGRGGAITKVTLGQNTVEVQWDARPERNYEYSVQASSRYLRFEAPLCAGSTMHLCGEPTSRAQGIAPGDALQLLALRYEPQPECSVLTPDGRTLTFPLDRLVASQNCGGALVTAENVFVGARVQRGPDWTYDDQDSFGLGTITSLPSSSGSVFVLWDGDRFQSQYRVASTDGKHDLRFIAGLGCLAEIRNAPSGTGTAGSCEAAPVASDVPSGSGAGGAACGAGIAGVIAAGSADAAPSPGDPVGPAAARPGLRVVRGPDWQWVDQDGGAGQPGVIVSVHANGWCVVRWDAGLSASYRFRDAVDLLVAPTSAGALPSALPFVVGDAVCLTHEYLRFGDAADGPLRPGDVGVVIQMDYLPPPILVRHVASGKSWWYAVACLERAREPPALTVVADTSTLIADGEDSDAPLLLLPLDAEAPPKCAHAAAVLNAPLNAAHGSLHRFVFAVHSACAATRVTGALSVGLAAAESAECAAAMLAYGVGMKNGTFGLLQRAPLFGGAATAVICTGGFDIREAMPAFQAGEEVELLLCGGIDGEDDSNTAVLQFRRGGELLESCSLGGSGLFFLCVTTPAGAQLTLKHASYVVRAPDPGVDVGSGAGGLAAAGLPAVELAMVGDEAPQMLQAAVSAEAAQSQRVLSCGSGLAKNRRHAWAFPEGPPGIGADDLDPMSPRLRDDFAAKCARLHGAIASAALEDTERYIITVTRSPPDRLLDGCMTVLGVAGSAAWASAMRVHFSGEEGIDAGGLSREWFTAVSAALLSAGIVRPTAKEGAFEYYINPHARSKRDLRLCEFMVRRLATFVAS